MMNRSKWMRGGGTCSMHETERERKKKSKYKVFVAESEEADHLKNLGIDEKIIVK
jgi:hypothetical protein